MVAAGAVATAAQAAAVAAAAQAAVAAVAVAGEARRRPVEEVGAGLQKAAELQQLVAGAGASRPWVEPERG